MYIRNQIIISGLLLTSLASTIFASSISNNKSSTKPLDPKISTSKENIALLEFIGPWGRPSMSPSNNSAAYLIIKNDSDDSRTLIGASAMDVANNVELHQSFVDEKGISRMVAIDKITIPAHSQVELKPGGIHIMLFDLKRSLKIGDKFQLDLKFESLGAKSIEVEIRSEE